VAPEREQSFFRKPLQHVRREAALVQLRHRDTVRRTAQRVNGLCLAAT
jgi:hypothetical protein